MLMRYNDKCQKKDRLQEKKLILGNYFACLLVSLVYLFQDVLEGILAQQSDWLES